MLHVLWVALGGALGASARYSIGVTLLRVYGGPAPVATWTVNLLGCLLIGVLAPLVAGPELEARRLLLVTGFLGSFTTFSTFSLDTLALWRAGETGWALLNVAGSVGLGLLFVALGLTIGAFLGR